MSSDGHELIKFLKNRGWHYIRHGKGSHQIWGKGPSVVQIPVSASTAINMKRMRVKILKLEQNPFHQRQT